MNDSQWLNPIRQENRRSLGLEGLGDVIDVPYRVVDQQGATVRVGPGLGALAASSAAAQPRGVSVTDLLHGGLFASGVMLYLGAFGGYRPKISGVLLGVGATLGVLALAAAAPGKDYR